jgi:hypothetical protein
VIAAQKDGEKAVIETCEISTTSASLSRQDGAA